MKTVDLVSFFPWAWLMHLIRALVSSNILFTTIKGKYNNFVTATVFIGSSMLYSFLTLALFKIAQNDNILLEILSMAMYYVLQFVVICFMCKGTIFSKIFVPLFSLITYTMSCSLLTLFASVFSDNAFENIFSTNLPLTTYLTSLFFIYSNSFISVIFIRIFRIKFKSDISYNNKMTFVFVFPIVHIFTTFSVFNLINSYPYSVKDTASPAKENAELLFVLIMFISIALDFSLLFIVDHIENVEQKNAVIQNELLKSKLDYLQIEMLKKEKQEFRKLKHDYANIVSTAKGFIEIGKDEKALAILDEFSNDMQSLLGFSICSNETINTILYIKKRQAEENGITLNIKISENGLSHIDDYDMCRILGNIIDNSINAVKKVNGKNKRICNVEIKINPDEIIVKNENPFNEEKSSVKAKSLEHGHGISIIKAISKKYNGSYTSSQNNGVWNCVTRLDNTSQICTPPPANFILTDSSLRA